MPRKKEYSEPEVIEKAMGLFWRNGYKTTSVRMLEKEMGINQFSIYSSFDNKQGVFLESIKCYKKKIKCITEKLETSSKGVRNIKQFFYDFVEFSKESEHSKGCLLVNTVNELGDEVDPLVKNEIINYTNDLKTLFINHLEYDPQKGRETVERQANYLMVSIQGLSVASKILDQEQINDFIETTFQSI